MKPRKKPNPQIADPQQIANTNNIMEFYNNYLRRLAGGDVGNYFSDKKEWWDKIENAQKTVKIYVAEGYEDEIDDRFSRPGNYSPAEFFSSREKPEQKKSGPQQIIKLIKTAIPIFKDKPSPLTTNGDSPSPLITKAEMKTLQDEGVFAPENREAQAARVYSKYRVIVSEVPYFDEKGEIETKKVITACAPNLMGSSPEDLKEFIDKAGNLKKTEYRNACETIANLIVTAAVSEGMENLDIAQFGLGVYLNKLTRPEQKEEAKNIMYEAFKNASEKNPSLHINWIIYSGKANQDKTAQIDKAAEIDKTVEVDKAAEIGKAAKIDDPVQKQIAAANKVFGGTNITAKEGDILTSKNLLNNGSDRTIGGKSNVLNPPTTEEKLAQSSFLMLVQSTLNPQLEKKYGKNKEEKKDFIMVESPPMSFEAFIADHQLNLNEKANRDHWAKKVQGQHLHLGFGTLVVIDNKEVRVPRTIFLIHEILRKRTKDQSDADIIIAMKKVLAETDKSFSTKLFRARSPAVDELRKAVQKLSLPEANLEFKNVGLKK